jgi:LysM repeat protein
MKDQLTDMNRDDQTLAQKLDQVAEQIQVSQQFSEDLEQKLRGVYEPQKTWFSFSRDRLFASLSWVALVLVVGLILDWSIHNLVRTAPGMRNSTPGFNCPVTQANGSLPPGTQTSENQEVMNYGNGELWTIVPPDGKIHMLPDNQLPNGSFALNWPWWKRTDAHFSFEGHRLEAEAAELIVEMSEPFYNLTSPTLIFPTTGCWEITARAGEASLTLVVEIVFGDVTATPGAITPALTPLPAATPIPDSTGYDWRGTKLYLAQSLPESRVEANILLLKESQDATVEAARALAQRFGIEGELYESPGLLPNSKGYLVTDGKQRLIVQSEMMFDYYPDYNDFALLSGGKNITLERASAAIDSFLKSHGFDFKYEIDKGSQIPGLYYVIPLLETERLPIRFDYNLPNRLEITVNDDGQITLMSSIRVDYESLQTYPIITAEEALQKILSASNSSPAGLLESFRSGEILIESFWQRLYPENETITIYGQPIFYPSFEADRSGFFAIGQYTAIGNTSGLENLDQTVTVAAMGQFFTENGIRRFNIESWSISDASQTSFIGTLRRDGEEALLTTDSGNEHRLQGIPADVPFDNQISVSGFMVDDNFVWTLIQRFASDSNRGGGGGGGIGFYKLNLSKTPVAFPTSTMQAPINQGSGEYIVKEGDTLITIAHAYNITIDELMQANNLTDPVIYIDQKLIIPSEAGQLSIGQHIERFRGIIVINIYRKPDGSQRVEYRFLDIKNKDGEGTTPNYILSEGTDLQPLQGYHNRPVDVWGTIDGLNENGEQVIKVDRFEIPYPDLKLQIVDGTQEITEIQGERYVTLQAKDGTRYVELGPAGDALHEDYLFRNEGDHLIVEALLIPDEMFGGYPALRVFGYNLAIDPVSGLANEITITADQPYVMEEPLDGQNFSPPTATIEKVELVYYTPDPRHKVPNSSGETRYIQPAWRFYGHFSNGDEFEFLVQALQQIYLLPEVVPAVPPG